MINRKQQTIIFQMCEEKNIKWNNKIIHNIRVTQLYNNIVRILLINFLNLLNKTIIKINVKG